MAAPYTVNIFIPHHILRDCNYYYLFGYYENFENYSLFNCTVSYCFCESYNITVEMLQKCLKDAKSSESLVPLGLLFESSKYRTIDQRLLKSVSCYVKFILCVDELKDAFNFVKLSISTQGHSICGQVIIYNGYDLKNSKLLTERNRKDNNDEYSFVEFLVKTVELAISETTINIDNQLFNLGFTKYLPIEYSESKNIWYLLNFLMLMMFHLCSTVFKKSELLFNLICLWWPAFFTKIILFSSVGKQLHQRVLHLSEVGRELRNKYLTLNCRNLIYAILLDILFGWIATYYLWHHDLPHILLDFAMKHTNDVVNGLQRLIHWLMGVPAGLKLNVPLNSTLGQFFLYHIYLWKTYMIIVKPLFSVILEKSSLIGILGITFLFSLVNDLISIATIHIYCFYGYATRLYGYQVLSLSALWRLFRGKKWNPLRQRVDSYTYDVYQLYVGTLVFTVLLFLLPTIVTYYIVFTSLRIVVLTLQGLISRIVDVLTICPVYAIILRVLNSSETTGDVYFSVMNKKDTLVLTMQAVQIPLSSVIKATLPKLHHYQDKLSWKNFLSSIVWGKIIYPL